MKKLITKMVMLMVVIAMGLNHTSADPKRHKREHSVINSIQNISGTIWNTLVRKEMVVSLLAITRDEFEQEKELRISLSDPRPTIDLNPILKKELVFITHGFISDGDEPWMRDLALAYLNRRNVTVFIVDWGPGANIIWYSEAVQNTLAVAQVLIDFITYLIQDYNIEASQIHLIGYSLGAHLFGFVGKGIPGINRITGLDPAERKFEDDSKSRLSKNDARFVDVIHTNTIEDGYGLRSSVGHVDFYINGGETQPGCTSLFGIGFLDLLFKYPCSHYRSAEYFLESVKFTDCVFVGVNKVSNSTYPTAELGLDTFNFHNGNVSGDYIVVTNSESPYCKN